MKVDIVKYRWFWFGFSLAILIPGLIVYYLGGLEWLTLFLLFAVALLFADTKVKEDGLFVSYWRQLPSEFHLHLRRKIL